MWVRLCTVGIIFGLGTPLSCLMFNSFVLKQLFKPCTVNWLLYPLALISVPTFWRDNFRMPPPGPLRCDSNVSNFWNENADADNRICLSRNLRKFVYSNRPDQIVFAFNEERNVAILCFPLNGSIDANLLRLKFIFTFRRYSHAIGRLQERHVCRAA